MTIKTTYEEARKNLAQLLDAAVNDRETVVIKRRGSADVAIVSADELRSLEETVHLLSSPANARRLFDALDRALAGEGIPMTIEQLRRAVGLEDG